MAAHTSFAFIKAAGNDAGLYTDAFFTANRSGSRASGIKRAFYFFTSQTSFVGRNGVTDANYFISVVGALQVGEIVVLDFDSTGGSYSGGMDTYSYDFCSTLKNFYGFNPTFYTSLSLAQTGLGWQTTSGITWLWAAFYNGNPNDWGRSVSAWSGNTPNYQWHQYNDNGNPVAYGASGSAIDLDSFYSPSGNLSDWDTFGAGGAPSSGTLTFATVTNPTMTYTTPAKHTLITPEDEYDQVLFSDIFKTTISSSSWPQSITRPTTNIDQYAYPIGNFDAVVNGVDIGTNDFGSIDISEGGFGQFPGQLPAVLVQPIVQSDGSISFDVSYTPGGSATINLTINFALMAYPNAINFTLSKVLQSVAYANVVPNEKGVYSTYRRIATDSSVGAGLITVPHGQSSIPNLLFWLLDNTGSIESQPSVWSSTGNLADHFGLAMDNTNIYFFVDNVNNQRCYYRVYKDN